MEGYDFSALPDTHDVCVTPVPEDCSATVKLNETTEYFKLALAAESGQK